MEENIVLETAFDRSVIFRCYVFKPVTILQLNLPAFSLPAVAQRLILSSTLNANMPSIPRGLSNDSVVQGSMVEIWKRKRGLCKFCHSSLYLSLCSFSPAGFSMKLYMREGGPSLFLSLPSFGSPQHILLQSVQNHQSGIIPYLICAHIGMKFNGSQGGKKRRVPTEGAYQPTASGKDTIESHKLHD